MTQKTKATATAVAKSINFTSYFKEEKDVYVQNVSAGQISLQFGRGDDAMSFTLRRRRDPINLTNNIPFKRIAESTDFRKMLARKPTIIKLLTQEEYDEYFNMKAKREKISVDEAITNAETAHANHKDQVLSAPKTTAPKDDDDKSAPPVQSEEEVINPRIIHLCHQASSKEIPEAERLTPTALLQELKDLESELKFDDLEYIQSKIANKTIKNWVMARQSEAS